MTTEYITAKDICARWGYCRQRVSQIAENRQIKPVGLIGATRVWPRDAMELFRPRKGGKPRSK